MLLDNNKITKEIYSQTSEFLKSNNNVPINKTSQFTNQVFNLLILKRVCLIMVLDNFFINKKQLDFESRAALCKNKMGKKLFEIMHAKQTNLCVAADFNSFDQLLKVKNIF